MTLNSNELRGIVSTQLASLVVNDLHIRMSMVLATCIHQDEYGITCTHTSGYEYMVLVSSTQSLPMIGKTLLAYLN